MSICLALEKKVLMQELFDGRLQQYGVVENLDPETTEQVRMLVDEQSNYLWVYANDDGFVSFLVLYGVQNLSRILGAIQVAFNTYCYTEYEPQYWGFDTQEEWDAAMEKSALEEQLDRHDAIH